MGPKCLDKFFEMDPDGALPSFEEKKKVEL